MTRWQDDRMTGWQDDRMTGSIADDWPYGISNGELGGRIDTYGGCRGPAWLLCGISWGRLLKTMSAIRFVSSQFKQYGGRPVPGLISCEGNTSPHEAAPIQTLILRWINNIERAQNHNKIISDWQIGSKVQRSLVLCNSRHLLLILYIFNW